MMSNCIDFDIRIVYLITTIVEIEAMKKIIRLDLEKLDDVCFLQRLRTSGNIICKYRSIYYPTRTGCLSAPKKESTICDVYVK